MNGRTSPTRRRRSSVTRRLTSASIAVMLAVILLSSVTLSGCSRIWAPELSSEPKNLSAAAKPAVVRIEGVITADVSVPFSMIDEAKLTSALEDMLAAGQLDPYDEAGVIEAAFQLVIDDPLTYIVPDPSMPPRVLEGVEVGVTGSGFIADPNGYIVTNAHVAAPDDKYMGEQIAAVGLEELIAEDIAAYQAAGGGIPEDLLEGMMQAQATWTAANFEVGEISKEYAVYMGAEIPGVAKGEKPTTAEVVAAGKEAPGKDIAVLKIPGKNLPTIPIGDDTQVETGDAMYVLGYPADATFHPMISEESFAEPTFNSGQCSAKKQSTEGFEVIQTDCDASPGNSGGPVLDEKGDVAGLLTFGTIDPESGQSEAGMNFVMPASLVKEFLDRAGAKPSESEFTKMYVDGLAEEAAGHNSDALDVFRQIDAMSPGHPYVQQRIATNQQAVSGGKDQELNPLLVFGAPIALIAAAALVLLFVLLTRRRQSQPAAVTAAPAAPTAPMQTAPVQAAPTETAPMESEGTATAPMPPPAESTPPTAAEVTPPAPTAPAAQSPAAGMPRGAQDPYEELRKLSELKDAGVISEEEFAAKKKEVLDQL